MLNKAKLRAEMVLHDDTQSKLADALGVSLSRVNAKINEWNGAEFTQTEIELISKRYGLTAKEMKSIFFAQEVS